MLILILINVQYSQKAVFSFQKGSNHKKHSSSGPLHPVKKSPPSHSLLLFGKRWETFLANFNPSVSLYEDKWPWDWSWFAALLIL